VLNAINQYVAITLLKLELFSKGRSVWRRKMIERFKKEYPYMVFLAEDYGSLFDTDSTIFYSGHYHDDDDSYFDS
jgi:hypothetical protein